MSLELLGLQKLEYELAFSVDPDIKDHWDKKISEGIVPTEVKRQGSVDLEYHAAEQRRLADFETGVVENLFESSWKSPPHSSELHYVGIGTGEAFRRVVRIANKEGCNVIGYDTSSEGSARGLEAVGGISNSQGNYVYLADIETVCQEKYLKRGKAGKLILPRVLDVLDKQDKDWQIRHPRYRKMARVARKIGHLLSFLEVLIIHPDSRDNPRAIWGDTNPCTLSDVAGYMRNGLQAPLAVEIVGKIDFHKHIYTAALIRRRLR